MFLTMEQHPVPQNVTTFQFRLIGDMTLKQFGYLCAGAILAFIAYKLPMPFIITWPLTMIFAFLGIGFAFIPIEERPMDVWVFSFFKSIYSPTQYLWTRQEPAGKPAAPAPPPPPQKPAAPVSPVSVPSVTGTAAQFPIQPPPPAQPKQPPAIPSAPAVHAAPAPTLPASPTSNHGRRLPTRRHGGSSRAILA